MAHPKGIDPAAMAKIAEFAKLFWASRGNHNDLTSQKFLPAFTFEQLEKAALIAQQNGAFRTAYADLPPLKKPSDLTRELESLRASLFDPAFEPMITAKSPAGGKDTIQASSNTFYQGVSLDDLKGFRREVSAEFAGGKSRGRQTYRTRLPRRHVRWQGSSRTVCHVLEAGQRIASRRRAATPNPSRPKRLTISSATTRRATTRSGWRSAPCGFRTMPPWTLTTASSKSIATHAARKEARRALSPSPISPLTTAMKKLAENAGYFEQKAPWDPKYKRESFKLPVVKAVETLIETGDFSVSTIGDNLPNENEIHETIRLEEFSVHREQTRARRSHRQDGHCGVRRRCGRGRARS